MLWTTADIQIGKNTWKAEVLQKKTWWLKNKRAKHSKRKKPENVLTTSSINNNE